MGRLNIDYGTPVTNCGCNVSHFQCETELCRVGNCFYQFLESLSSTYLARVQPDDCLFSSTCFPSCPGHPVFFSFDHIPAGPVTCCCIISIPPTSLLPLLSLSEVRSAAIFPLLLFFFAFVAHVLLNIYPFSSPVFLPPDSN